MQGVAGRALVFDRGRPWGRGFSSRGQQRLFRRLFQRRPSVDRAPPNKAWQLTSAAGGGVITVLARW